MQYFTSSGTKAQEQAKESVLASCSYVGGSMSIGVERANWFGRIWRLRGLNRVHFHRARQNDRSETSFGPKQSTTSRVRSKVHSNPNLAFVDPFTPTTAS